MKLLKVITVSAIATLISTSIWAQTADSNPSAMSMQGAMPYDMNPQMMEAMRQHHMQNAGQSGMPMMGGDQQGMTMDPQRMQNMMAMRQQQMGQPGNRPMMGQYGAQMRPQMRQQMMAMRQQHMQQMEQRLTHIESMLTELLALQKQK